MAALAPHTAAPDLALPGIAGGTINPADFRGERLALFLCPHDPAEAAREIEAWRTLADRFASAGVWLLGIAHESLPDECIADKSGRHISIARDSDSRLQSMLLPCLGTDKDAPPPDPSAGAAFLFERWGSLDRAWPAAGHAQDVLEAATEQL